MKGVNVLSYGYKPGIFRLFALHGNAWLRPPPARAETGRPRALQPRKREREKTQK
jgi:hypothetical protein